MEALVIGAGVVGLAIAADLARKGVDVIVAEQAKSIGTGVSSRNSEVIHAGMYYPTASLRAQHCVAGRQRLYAYCAQRGVAHAKPGKLIVATTPAEVSKLEVIQAQGHSNGVTDLEMLTGAQAIAREPALSCIAALWSPETGIIDSHGLMLALQGEMEDHGGRLALVTQVHALRQQRNRWLVSLGQTGKPGSAADDFEFDVVINSAGLCAQAIARKTLGFPTQLIPKRVLAKGNYFGFQGKPVFSSLIYPAPVDGGLGTHVTLDLAGRMRFGPDVEWIENETYDVAPGRAQTFYDSIRRYFPNLPDDSLVPDYAGIRPKLSGPGEPAKDFVLSTPDIHGMPGLVHLFGIESPGLTSCLSLAEAVTCVVLDQPTGPVT
jgi:L-2-hydroxyglutarate oxidase LhgO